jgi:hypothetical protein
MCKFTTTQQDSNGGGQTVRFMALLLGVRRVGVTKAASEFQKTGVISYHGGEITVQDRAALKARACSCYAADLRLFTELTQKTIR